MADSLKFGTSGLRGLATDLTGGAARRYAAAFLAHLGTPPGGRVYLGRDLRASSPAIAADCAVAIRAAGLVPVDCGVLPTPALALHAMALGGPAIMVTGSHIPADRNGLKFYSPRGEITKEDEAGIAAALGEAVPEAEGRTEDGYAAAGDRYRQRYRHLLPPGTLAGLARRGVRAFLGGARPAGLAADAGRGARWCGSSGPKTSSRWTPRPSPTRSMRRARRGSPTHRLDAVVSTDGDGDRPLVIDGEAEFVRGDVLGMIAARFVGASRVVTPVTSNSAIEGVGWFAEVERTRVGSPYVIAAMEEKPDGVVVGFEANGGTLLGSDVVVEGVKLSALPTRDAVLPILAALGSAARAGTTLAALVASLPVRAALSDRLAEVPGERSAELLRRLADEPDFAASFFAPVGGISSVSAIDGLRFTLGTGDVVHYRASGNAPELRCYVEGATPERAGSC